MIVTASTMAASAVIPNRMTQTLRMRSSMMARIIARLQVRGIDERKDHISSFSSSSSSLCIDAIDNARALKLLSDSFLAEDGTLRDLRKSVRPRGPPASTRSSSSQVAATAKAAPSRWLDDNRIARPTMAFPAAFSNWYGQTSLCGVVETKRQTDWADFFLWKIGHCSPLKLDLSQQHHAAPG
jgi:hypothetical protein